MGVGASGAIFGLLGLLAVLTPRKKIYLIAGPLIALILEFTLFAFIKNENLLSILIILVNIYFFIAIFAMFSPFKKIAVPIEMSLWVLPIVAIVPLVVIGLFISLHIGNMAHLGGLVAGLIYGFYLRSKYKKKVYLLNRMFGVEDE